MAGFDLAFWSLFYKMVSRQTGQLSRVTFEAQKPHFENTPIEQPFERAKPESVGISSEHVRDFIRELGTNSEAQPHHLMILRHGNVIAECSFKPYVDGMWHITHSMCKTMTGMAVGLLVEDGQLQLDETLDSIFPSLVPILSRIGRKPVTIEQLLNMTSNVDFSESGAISGNDWKKGFMSAQQKAEPGSKFDYNSMNSYMLSAVIQERTGETMFDYLKERLFDPMGIREVHWEHSPEGITKGGWGMLIRPEDALKLGYLYLNHGKWNDRQLIPEYWVETSTSLHAENDKFGYGYQLWMDERPGSFAFNGLFGQNIICYPDLDMVLMINAGNRELTAGGALTSIIRKYWGNGYTASEEPLPDNGIATAELSTMISRMAGVLPFPPKPRNPLGIYPEQEAVINRQAFLDALNGRYYRMEHGQIGVFPLISQVMHVNFTDGISRVGFEKTDDEREIVLLLTEGETEHRIIAGFDQYKTVEIDLHGDPYLVASQAHLTTDENGRVALLVRMTFPEEGMDRILKLYFNEETLELRASEKPGDAVIVDALNYTSDTPALNRIPFVKNIMEGGAMDLVDITVQSTIHPVDYGTPEERENREEREEENGNQ